MSGLLKGQMIFSAQWMRWISVDMTVKLKYFLFSQVLGSVPQNIVFVSIIC